MDATTRNGGFDGATDAVERLTGLPPRRFRDVLVEHRDAFLAARPQA